MNGLRNADSFDSVRSRQGSAGGSVRSRQGSASGSGNRFVSILSGLLKGNKRTQSMSSQAYSLDDSYSKNQSMSIDDFTILKPISRGAFG
jgi:hypothetical protein